MYYTVIKHDGHLRTRGKCRQHEPQASAFYISRVFSNVQSVLSQCNTRLRLLHLLYDIEVMWQKTIKHALSVLYSDKTRVFDQSERAYYPIYIIILDKSRFPYNNAWRDWKQSLLSYVLPAEWVEWSPRSLLMTLSILMYSILVFRITTVLNITWRGGDAFKLKNWNKYKAQNWIW